MVELEFEETELFTHGMDHTVIDAYSCIGALTLHSFHLDTPWSLDWRWELFWW